MLIPGSLAGRTSANDSSRINKAAANSIGKGSTTPPKPQATLQKNRVKGGVYNSSGTN